MPPERDPGCPLRATTSFRRLPHFHTAQQLQQHDQGTPCLAPDSTRAQHALDFPCRRAYSARLHLVRLRRSRHHLREALPRCRGTATHRRIAVHFPPTHPLPQGYRVLRLRLSAVSPSLSCTSTWNWYTFMFIGRARLAPLRDIGTMYKTRRNGFDR